MASNLCSRLSSRVRRDLLPEVPLDASALAKFGYLMAALLVGVFGVAIPATFGGAVPVWPWVAALVFAGLAVARPLWLFWPCRGWLALGRALGFVTTPIVLGIVFYLVMTPIGLVWRCVVTRRPDQASPASYRTASALHAPDQMTRPY